MLYWSVVLLFEDWNERQTVLNNWYWWFWYINDCSSSFDLFAQSSPESFYLNRFQWFFNKNQIKLQVLTINLWPLPIQFTFKSLMKEKKNIHYMTQQLHKHSSVTISVDRLWIVPLLHLNLCSYVQYNIRMSFKSKRNNLRTQTSCGDQVSVLWLFIRLQRNEYENSWHSVCVLLAYARIIIYVIKCKNGRKTKAKH